MFATSCIATTLLEPFLRKSVRWMHVSSLINVTVNMCEPKLHHLQKKTRCISSDSVPCAYGSIAPVGTTGRRNSKLNPGWKPTPTVRRKAAANSGCAVCFHLVWGSNRSGEDNARVCIGVQNSISQNANMPWLCHLWLVPVDFFVFLIITWSIFNEETIHSCDAWFS